MHGRLPSNAPLEIAVIGAGAMGANHARTIAAGEQGKLGLVVDSDEESARKLADLYAVPYSLSPDDAATCDAAIVATPAESHLEVAAGLIRQGTPVLVEKPLASDLSEVDALIDLAGHHGTPMMCGFVERFNPVVTTAREHLAIEGDVLHVLGVRHSPPNPRAALSVVHDLLIHDLDLVFTLTGEWGTVDASGTAWSSASTGFDEIADATMLLRSGALATVSASRAGQRKVREFRVSTATALFELDLLRRTLTVYRHVSQEALLFSSGYRAETVVDIPFVRQEGEPLTLQLRHFIDLIEGDVDVSSELATIRPAHQVAAAVEVSSRLPQLARL